MKMLTDDELIKELEGRFAFNQKALTDLQEMTKKLESMNAKLQDSETVKSHFLSNIRNEINNPLTSIMGLSQQCLCSPGESDRCSSIARMIYHEAFTLDFQLQNIFVAAELEVGEADPAFANVDVSTIIDRVVESFEFQINEKQMVVKADRKKPLAFSTDARMVRLILANLLGNAVEFGAEGGRVDVTVQAGDGMLKLIVKDDGEVTPVVEHHVGGPAVRPLDGLLNAPLIFLFRLLFPGKNRGAACRNRRRCVILGGEDVARRPAHVGPKMLESLDENGGLDGHVDATGDACALERLALAKLRA